LLKYFFRFVGGCLRHQFTVDLYIRSFLAILETKSRANVHLVFPAVFLDQTVGLLDEIISAFYVTGSAYANADIGLMTAAGNVDRLAVDTSAIAVMRMQKLLPINLKKVY
jgi:hypothetical protein